MSIYGIVMGILFVSIILNFIKWISEDKSKKLKIIMVSFYFIKYSLFIMMAYFITDTLKDFFIVSSCFLVIYFMFSVVYREWFKSKLYLRMILVSIVPIITMFILSYCSPFILFNNIFLVFMAVAISANISSSSYSKRKFLEFALFVIGFIISIIMMQRGYFGEFHNKPQVHAINKMLDELEISYDDIVRIGKDGGVRGELINVSFKTKEHYCLVYYKDSNIVRYKLLD